jgi:hypothetical protein
VDRRLNLEQPLDEVATERGHRPKSHLDQRVATLAHLDPEPEQPPA